MKYGLQGHESRDTQRNFEPITEPPRVEDVTRILHLIFQPIGTAQRSHMLERFTTVLLGKQMDPSGSHNHAHLRLALCFESVSFF